MSASPPLVTVVSAKSIHDVGQYSLLYGTINSSAEKDYYMPLIPNAAYVGWTEGAVTVPEPSIKILLFVSLIGLVGAGTVRKIRMRKVANS